MPFSSSLIGSSSCNIFSKHVLVYQTAVKYHTHTHTHTQKEGKKKSKQQNNIRPYFWAQKSSILSSQVWDKKSLCVHVIRIFFFFFFVSSRPLTNKNGKGLILYVDTLCGPRKQRIKKRDLRKCKSLLIKIVFIVLRRRAWPIPIMNLSLEPSPTVQKKSPERLEFFLFQ